MHFAAMEGQENILPEILAELMSDFDDAPGCSDSGVTTEFSLTDLLDESILNWLSDETTTDARPSAKAVKVLSDSARFGNQVTSTDEFTRASKGFVVPKNTSENTKWAIRNFESGQQWRRKHSPVDPVPDDLLECNDPTLLNKWLSLYMMETRRVDGEKFPSKSLDLLLAGLLRYTRDKNPFAVNFLDDKDPNFVRLRGRHNCS